MVISMNCIYPVIKARNHMVCKSGFCMRSFDEVILLLRVLCQRKNVIMFQYKKKPYHFNHLFKSFRAIAGIYMEQTMRFLFLLGIRFGCTNRNVSFNSVMFLQNCGQIGVLRCIVWSPLYQPQCSSLAFYKMHNLISSSWFR